MSVGFGYGLAHALSEAGPAYNAGVESKRKADLEKVDSDLRVAAEARLNAESKDRMATYGIQRNITIANQLAPGFKSEAVVGPVAPPVTPTGAPTEPALGGPVDAATGTPTEVIRADDLDREKVTYDKGGFPIPASRSDKVVATPGYGVGKLATDKAPGAGLAPKEESKMTSGKRMTMPGEGDGFFAQATQVRAGAEAIKARTAEVLKSIEDRYRSNPQLVEFLKSPVEAAANAKVEEMHGNAARLESQGVLANHMQVGAAFAEKLLGHFKTGGTIDKKFVDDNAGAIRSLGIDLSVFDGMHLNKATGFVENRGGYAFPEDGFLVAANAALPPEERAKGWKRLSDVMEFKRELDVRSAQVRAQSPEAYSNWMLATNEGINRDYTAVSSRRDELMAALQYGGKVPAKVDGKDVIITLPNNQAQGWFQRAQASKSPAYKVVLDQIEMLDRRRENLASGGRMLSVMTRSGARVDVPGYKEPIVDLQGKLIEKKEQAKAAAELRNRRILLNQNPDTGEPNPPTK